MKTEYIQEKSAGGRNFPQYIGTVAKYWENPMWGNEPSFEILLGQMVKNLLS